jgi:SulP family sulfate permease
VTPTPGSSASLELRFDRQELSGAFADLGVFVPIAVALIVKNGLSATAVLLPAGLLYLTVAWLYRLPVPVQPLKAFGAIAIAAGIGRDGIAAGALLMGAIFIVLGASGLLDLAARVFPQPIIRGVQLSVGILFLQVAWGLVSAPPHPFLDASVAPPFLVLAAVVVALAAFLLRDRPIMLGLVLLGGLVALARHSGGWTLGPTGLTFPHLDPSTLATALVVLVVPQLPLTFANSCLATADAARVYFGERSSRVRPGRLAMSLGVADLLAGAISGMPVCHGAGGMTAHVAFGARSAAAPLTIGTVLVVLGVVFGAGLAGLLAGFPLPILAGLLATVGILHIALLRDLRGVSAWGLALLVGILGWLTNLTVSVGLGLLVWWGWRGVWAAMARFGSPAGARPAGARPAGEGSLDDPHPQGDAGRLS